MVAVAPVMSAADGRTLDAVVRAGTRGLSYAQVCASLGVPEHRRAATAFADRMGRRGIVVRAVPSGMRGKTKVYSLRVMSGAAPAASSRPCPSPAAALGILAVHRACPVRVGDVVAPVVSVARVTLIDGPLAA